MKRGNHITITPEKVTVCIFFLKCRRKPICTWICNFCDWLQKLRKRKRSVLHFFQQLQNYFWDIFCAHDKSWEKTTLEPTNGRSRKMTKRRTNRFRPSMKETSLFWKPMVSNWPRSGITSPEGSMQRILTTFRHLTYTQLAIFEGKCYQYVITTNSTFHVLH